MTEGCSREAKDKPEEIGSSIGYKGTRGALVSLKGGGWESEWGGWEGFLQLNCKIPRCMKMTTCWLLGKWKLKVTSSS